MPKRKKAPRGNGKKAPLLTLTELAREAGVSVGTAHRYRQELGTKLPSVGEGRTTRYPAAAVAVMQSLREEKAGKKGGRPRSRRPPEAVAAGKKKAASKAGGELLSLRRIGTLTGISYPTLLRYVARYGEQIPQTGTGRSRRFPPAAVPVFQELRATRGRAPRATAGTKERSRPRRGAETALVRRLQALEKSHAELTRQLRRLQQLLDRPWTVTFKRGRTAGDSPSPRRRRGGPTRAPEGESRPRRGRRGAADSE